jgi:predicted membrane-bound dolichyl-phosphate-mannose-protein mannosyltransferase
VAALIGTMAMMSFVAVIGPVVRMLGLSEWHAGLSVTAAGVLWMLAARPGASSATASAASAC